MIRLPTITSLTLLVACGGPTPARTINGDPDGDWPSLPALDEEIVEIMEADRVAGLSACIIEDGQLAWCGGYGEANPDNGMLATPSTPFLLASVSKVVTGVAIMQAVEQGALSLDDPINDHLSFEVIHPDAPNSDITTRQLMAHVSGIVDNWDALESHYVTGDSDEDLGEFLEGYLTEGGADYDAWENFHEDGVNQTTEYSNSGAALAGYMVEASTGTPFDDYCDETLFGPLNMNAGWHLADFDVDQVATPTQWAAGEWEVIDHYGFPDYPNGQLRADARSMARLLAAIAQGGTVSGTEVLSQSSVTELVTVYDEDLDEDQGLMWYQWSLDGETVIGHNGGETGVSTEILVRPSDGRGVVVLMNSEGGKRTLEKIEIAALNAL
ncbi:MAG: CubicO group peptidase (beta-lactamase class C family) [Myxococcota bacterium]|jgi:CubicO group peptidase (beta-lactamase class C family)